MTPGGILVHDHVHAGRLAAGEGALDGGADSFGLGHELAVAAQALDDLVVAALSPRIVGPARSLPYRRARGRL